MSNLFYKYKSINKSEPTWTEQLLIGNLYTPALKELNDPFEDHIEVFDKETLQLFSDNYGIETPEGSFKSLSQRSEVDYAFITALFSPEEILHAVQNGVVKPVLDLVRVQCLSKRLDSIGMWTYYANEFKGFVLEYKEDDLMIGLQRLSTEQSITHFSNIRKIEYTDDRLFPIKKITEQEIITNLTKKFSDWSHEEEFRILLFAKKLSSKIAMPVKPQRVIIGFNMPEEDKKFLKILATKHSIPTEEISKDLIKKMLQERAAQRTIMDLAEKRVRAGN